jgi:catechol 2,3-dioxygenase-like lactoylglutathione lyase family enzyme
MEAQRLHRGRLVDHIQLVVKNLTASKRFYAAVLAELKIPLGGEGDDYFWYDELFVSGKDSRAAAGILTGRVHLAFQADGRDTVDRVYRVALAAGGWDNGAPGERPYHAGYYAGFVLDPDGNNIEVVHHGAARRSVASIELEFEA